MKTAVYSVLSLATVIAAGSQAPGATDPSLSSADQWVTVSLVPDGTQVGPVSSSLMSCLSATESDARSLPELVAFACQQWAAPTNLNVSLVQDSGLPLGSRGLTRHDPRFGDIRIAAIPLPAGVRGVAFSRDDVVAGTWAGDIILNSNAIGSSQELLEVLVHELGHSLGFEHVEGTPSVLNPVNHRIALTDFDIALVQQRFGPRNLDPNEVVRSNDTFNRATRLRLRKPGKDSLPALAFGDLSGPDDVDLFELRPEQQDDTWVTVQVRTKNNSLVPASLQLISEAGDLVGQSETSWQSGGMGELTVPARDLGRRCFVRIVGQAGDFSIGGYALVAFYDTPQIDPAVLAATASWRFSHLSQDDARYLLRDGIAEFFFADDLHTNDSLTTATVLDPIKPLAGAEFFRVDASVSDEVDRDFYAFSIPAEFAAHPVTLRVLSRDEGLLIPQLEVFNRAGQPVPFRHVANGNGLLVLQMDAAWERDYVVAVAGNQKSLTPYTTGNYTLEIRSDRPRASLLDFAQGSFQDGAVQFHTLRVARAQMFHFGLAGSFQDSLENLVIFASLYDVHGKRVFQVATRSGEFRSSQSLLLSPGSYVLRIEGVGATGGESLAGISYVFSGTPDTDNEGPTLLDPTASPFSQCDPTRDVYCYPDGESSDPFIWVDGLSPDLLQPADPLNPWDNIDPWYWPDMAIA